MFFETLNLEEGTCTGQRNKWTKAYFENLPEEVHESYKLRSKQEKEVTQKKMKKSKKKVDDENCEQESSAEHGDTAALEEVAGGSMASDDRCPYVGG